MHPEALDDIRKKIFSRLRNFSGFYLAGGTALALQIGHRVSVDFDLFFPAEIPPDLFVKAGKVFFGIQLSPLVNNREELSILVDGVKITFLYYPFPLIRAFVKYEGLNLLSVAEIAATKAYTVGRRGSYKDYVDLYFSLSEKYASLGKIIADASKKYGREFNDRLFLEQLVYLEDIEEEPIIFLRDHVSKSDIKRYFEKFVGKIKL